MKKLIWFLPIIFFFAACGPSTQITGSWMSPEAKQKTLNSVLVTALTDKTNVRQTVEDDLAVELRKNGINPVKSFDVMPPTFTAGKQPDREALLDKIKDTGVDAILTVALIDKETENRYIPGDYGYAPIPRFGYYGRFWGYYNNWYPVLYAPGYYTEDKTYFWETNLYDAETEELLWSAQSETYNPTGLTDFSKEISSIVLTKMEEDGVIQN